MRVAHSRLTATAVALATSLIAAAACAASIARADPVADFYRGKTVKMIVNSTPGAGYDIYARLVARHMANHIPGRPTVVAQNLPGAGGRAAAVYAYSVAAKDGLTLAALNRSVALAQVMGDPNLGFDNARFNWIGNPDSDNSTLATWHTSGVRTIEDARTKEITVGTTGDGNSSIYPRVMNAVLGTRFKIVRGYPGGNEVNLAMEKGEVQGRGDNAWGSWKSARPEWLRDRQINIVVQIGLRKAPDCRTCRCCAISPATTTIARCSICSLRRPRSGIRSSPRRTCRRNACAPCARPSTPPCATPRWWKKLAG
jgi:hypothetical protein